MGAYKPLFVGVSDSFALYPIAPRGADAAARAPGRAPLEPGLGGHGRTPFGPLVPRLHARFCKFQAQAKRIQERVEATQMPVESSLAEDVLQLYSYGVADELRQARDELRRGKWDIDPAVRADHDTLCVCLAVWELTHEVVVSSAPSAARLIHWYNRHYLEEDLAEWWQKAVQWAEDPEALRPESPFWEPLCRLALSDCRAEVLALLQRSAEAADRHVAHLCEFLRKIPSLQQMEQARASKVEYHQAMGEIQGMARRLLSEVPPGHPTRLLLRIYAGCPQSVFEANEDVAAEMGRTWVEDVAYANAWVLPELRKTELGDLLRAVAQRRTAESIDDIDRVLFAVLTLDVPGLLQLLGSLPERFPPFFVAHLVDVLYFAGRVPLVVEAEGQKIIPPRDWHLMKYAKELGCGPRLHRRLAVDYLRAGGPGATAQLLELAAGEYCASAATEAEAVEAMALLVDLDLAAKLGPKLCRRRAEELRAAGDVPGCVRWACQAEQHAAPPRGFHVSEALDRLAGGEDGELQALLALLTPPNLEEPLGRYPPEYLLCVLAPSGAPLALAPSGRLYFFVQLARCRALRRAGRPAAEYAPMLVSLLTAGVVAPAMACAVVEDDLLPALLEEDGPPVLSPEEAMLLLRYVHGARGDPLGRVQLCVPPEDILRVLGGCLSRAVLQTPPRLPERLGHAPEPLRA